VLDEFGAHIRKDNEVTTVVAGVIEREGKIFICQRREDQPHALKWEFPGGKVEPGESPEVALVRELEEELGIEAEIDTEVMRYEFSYPEKKPILLIFFAVTQWQGEIENRIFREVRWERREKLKEFDFLEGDAPFIAAQAP
jgi:8-oxo-dGTP diphosphatase